MGWVSKALSWKKEQCDLKQMQRVTASKAANSGICPLAMSTWVAGRRRPQLLAWYRPQQMVLMKKKGNTERRKRVLFQVQIAHPHLWKANKNSLCLPREKSLPIQQDERREPVAISLFKLIAKTNVFHSSISHDGRWLWPWRRPFSPEAQAILYEPGPLTGPCLACKSPPPIRLHLPITKLTALKERTHLTKIFLTLHQDETPSWSHETCCWQLSSLRAASVCVYVMNKGAAAPWHVGFTVRDFVPNFNNLKGRNSQPCPNDLDMKRSSDRTRGHQAIHAWVVVVHREGQRRVEASAGAGDVQLGAAWPPSSRTPMWQ